MGRFVPPHRRQEAALAVAHTSEEIAAAGATPAEQLTAWNALSRSIVSIFNRLNTNNTEEIAKDLLRENILRGRGVVALTVLKTQDLNPEMTPALVSVLTLLNVHEAEGLSTGVVRLICYRLIREWTPAYRRKDWMRVENINTFLAWLYIFQVIGLGIVLEVMLTLLTSPKRSDEDVALACKLFRCCFKAIAERARREFHTEVVQTFRDLLAMDDAEELLSARSQTAIEGCLLEVQKWDKTKDEVSLIPPQLVCVDLDAQPCHELELNEAYPIEATLDRFAFDPEYQKREAQYEAVRRQLLGDDWEVELLEKHIADEEAEEEAEGEAEAVADEEREGESSSAVRHAPTTETERRIRREVYLTIRNSVRADEVVHKLLKNLEPASEKTVCFMVIEGCCEEKDYKRIYEMVAERLCKTRTHFQSFFITAFRERYLNAEDLTVKQIQHSTALFAHLLRTDSLYWSRCLSVLNSVLNNVSQRIFMENLFNSLVERLGMEDFLLRMREPELLSQASRLFPLQDRDDANLAAAIDFFVAIRLDGLTQELRTALESRLHLRKRQRDEGNGAMSPSV